MTDDKLRKNIHHRDFRGDTEGAHPVRGIPGEDAATWRGNCSKGDAGRRFTTTHVNCVHCGEKFCAGDRIYEYANGLIAHLNCHLRGVFGSIAHQEKKCSCYVPGAQEGDPPGMTKREAADAAVKYWREHNK